MADYYTLLTDAGIAYETACKAAGIPIKLAKISVGDGNGAVYNPAASAKALKREVWRGPLNALFQDEKNANWLMAEVTIPSEVGGWYVREAGLWTDTGILYAVVKYPESYKPVLATSGAGKEFYIRSIFETSNAALVTLLIDDTVVKATRAWVMDYLGKGTYSKAEIEAMIAKASALPVGSIVAFPVNKVAPGFLEIDGSIKSASIYPDLSAFLGGAFNKGDEGVGNFRMPESRGEFLRGWDHGRGVDVGREVGSWQKSTLQAFDYSSDSLAVAGLWHTGPDAGALSAHGLDAVAQSNYPISYVIYAGGNQPTQNVGLGGSRPRNLAVVWCIKAWNAPINQGNIDIAALALLAAQSTEVNQGTAKVATAVQMLDSANDWVMVTPKKLRWGFATSFTPTGYFVFPSWLGGLVIQWGAVEYQTSGDSLLPVSYPVEFPNSVLYADWTVESDILSSVIGAYVHQVTKKGMTLTCDKQVTSAATIVARWFAFGR
ncbi:phage tail-collar fiber domain-containing protein [Pseudomonas sp.]|uniref:phage tail-collar fiber domain-containing protein n=1 Tax=Pseudomonas sp. TaxID=306 RepID=UPI003C322C15